MTADVTNRKWVRDDGTELLTSRILIDANWASSTDAVYKFCKASVAPVIPCHGRYIGASSQPMSEYKRKRGDRRGLNWHVPSVSGKRAVRYVAFDANFWKSFVTARLATALGDPGCLTLFSDKPQTHRMLADHLTSEMRVRTEGRGRTVDEWKLKPAASDNHWFDCLVGCAVAASMLGASLEHEPTEPKRRPPPPDRQVRRVSYL